MEGKLEYFYCKFDYCPYCTSDKVKIKEGSYRILGCHAFATVKCNGCDKEWVTDNRIHINWQMSQEAIDERRKLIDDMFDKANKNK